MIDLVPVLLPRLQHHRLPGLSLTSEAIFPYYQGYSLANLPASICHWLGIPTLAGMPFGKDLLEKISGPYQQVVLLVVDGLGLNFFQHTAQPADSRKPIEAKKISGTKNDKPIPVWGRILADALLAPLTSVVPSTTATALTTLWTGVSGLAHGILGYEIWLKEYGMIANMIHQSPATFHADTGGLRRAGFQPETFLPVQTLGPHLRSHGVQPYSFQPASIARSGLSIMHTSSNEPDANMPQVQVMPFRTQSDLWISLENVLTSPTDQPIYCYVYWSDLDDLGHRYGPEDERVFLEFTSFGLMVERFLARIKHRSHPRTLFVMISDHGQVATPTKANYDLRNHPELLSCLTMYPSGEGRLPYLFTRPGREDFLRDYIAQVWPGNFQLLRADQVLDSGLFGTEPPYWRVRDRLGDWVAVASGNAYWWWGDRENPLLGRHGSLSPTEMLVPMLAIEL